MEQLVKKIVWILRCFLALLLVVSIVSTINLFKKNNSPATTTVTTAAAVAETTRPPSLTPEIISATVAKVLGWDGNYSSLTAEQKESIISAFSAAGYQVELTDSGIVELNAASSTTTSAEETTALLPGETAAPGTTVPAGTTTTKPATTKPANTKPTTTPEIVSYYNAAANKVKADKPGYTRSVTNIKPEISNNKIIAGVAPAILAFFSFGKPEVTTAPKGDNKHISEFPLEGQSYGSKLQPDSLKDATCVDKGTSYEITMNFVDEKLDTLPPDTTKTRHGQALNVLSKGEVDAETVKFESLAKVEKFAPTYTGNYISCKIDKATGNLLSATYYFKTKADITAKILLSSVSVTVDFGVIEEYALTY